MRPFHRYLAFTALCLMAVQSFAQTLSPPISPKRAADNPASYSETLLQTTGSWDGTPYVRYPGGQPQVSVLRIYIPPHSVLSWHQHPTVSAAYLLAGNLTLEKRDSGQQHTFHAGEAITETVGITHRGRTADQSATLIVFYAGSPGLPLSIQAY